MTLIDIIKDEAIPFKKPLDDLHLEDLFIPCLTAHSSSVFESIKISYKNAKEKNQTLNLLNSLKKYDNAQIYNENYVKFRAVLMNSLMYLGEFADAQTYLKKSSDPYYFLVMSAAAIMTLTEIPAMHILYSKESKISQIIMEGLDDAYSKQLSDQAIAQDPVDNINSFNWYHSCITLLIQASQTISLLPDFQQKLTRHLEQLMKCMQNHPEVLKTNGAEYYTTLLLAISVHPAFCKFAKPLFDYAKQKNILTNQDTIKRFELLFKLDSVM
jgi:hypothetical protein